MENKLANISIVVPVFNEERFIEGCLDSLLHQKNSIHQKNYEIIVVDDGSNDSSAEKIKSYPVKLVQLKENAGKIHARKIGAESAQYSNILFVDARVRISEDLLDNCRNIGYTPLMTGRQIDLERGDLSVEERLFFLIRKKYYYPYFPLDREKRFFYIEKNNFYKTPKGTTCLLINKDLFLESIPAEFDKHSNDDTGLFEYIVFKKGIKILRHHDMAITYIHRNTSKELSQWVIRRGVTFFDFYIKKNLLLRIVVIFSPAIATVCFLLFPQIILFCLVIALTLYLGVVGYLSERLNDFFLVSLRLWKYLLCFYIGILKGWFIRRKNA